MQPQFLCYRTPFAADGSIANDGTRDFFRTFMERFAPWIELVLR